LIVFVGAATSSSSPNNAPIAYVNITQSLLLGFVGGLGCKLVTLIELAVQTASKTRFLLGLEPSLQAVLQCCSASKHYKTQAHLFSG